ncbi:MAG: hypothetical protein OXR67_13845 [Chloroflexota bacterium]|nr:hypothetical protein [Chloroflexota bacterium]
MEKFTYAPLVALLILMPILLSGCFLQTASAGEKLGNSVQSTQEQSQVMGQSLELVADPTMFEATPVPEGGMKEEEGVMAANPFKDTRSPQQLYIQQVRDQWQPRYENAVDAHMMLSRRLGETREYANLYFEEQAVRIGSINTDAAGGNRIRVSLQDSLDRQKVSYDAWMAQAQGIHKQSEAIMQQLHNMNTAIEFAVVAVDFDVLVEDLIILPASIQQLQQDLGQFQTLTIDLTSELGTHPSSKPQYEEIGVGKENGA